MQVSIQVLVYLVMWTAALALIAPSYRSVLVLTAGKSAGDFPRGKHEGPAWYQRTLDAHANALENLPLYAGVVLAGYAAGALDMLNELAWIYLGARILQSLSHLISTSHWFVMARFTFWLIQMGLILSFALSVLGCI